MKRYKNGLLIGKFRIPHLGHEAVIKFGSLLCHRLDVLITDKELDIPLDIREIAFRSNLRTYNVVYNREVDQSPDTDLDTNGTAINEFFWQYCFCCCLRRR